MSKTNALAERVKICQFGDIVRRQNESGKIRQRGRDVSLYLSYAVSGEKQRL